MDSLEQIDSSDVRPSQGPDSLIENMLCDDVLNVIFKFFVCEDCPHRVSQVCFRWRAIALNDSTLWNHILINEDKRDRRLTVRDITLRSERKDRRGRHKLRVLGNAFPDIKRMLQRSRTQPLHIFIDLNVRDHHSHWEFYHTKSLAALLTPYVFSIKTLCISSSGVWKHSAILLEILRGHVLSNLTTLKIDRSYDDLQEFTPGFDAATYKEQTAPVPRSRLSFLPGAPEELLCPSLRRLILTGTFHDWDRFVARNLSRLTITRLPFRARFTVVQLRTMLEMSSGTLELLNLTGAMPFLEPEDGMVLPPLTLTRLTNLTLGYTMPLELNAFASNFLVPALTHLYITNLDERTPEDLEFAEESEIYGDTLASFTVVLALFPFDKLEVFTLRGAQFGSPTPYIATEEMAANGSVSLSSLPVPLQLLQRLKNARRVRLDNPDRFLLMGMLYPQLDMLPKDRKEEDDDLNVPIVLSNVKKLCFEVDTDDQAHRSVMRYLGDRRRRYLATGPDGKDVFVGQKIDFLRLSFPLVTREGVNAMDARSFVVAEKTFLDLGDLGCAVFPPL